MEYCNGILNRIIYGNLYRKNYNALLEHDCMKIHQEKFKFKRLDMDYHFTMCERTKGFQSRYHMTESAYTSLVDILHHDITLNETKSRNSTGNNEPIIAKIVTYCGLRFMGGEKVKSLGDIYGISTRQSDRAVAKFLDAVDSSNHPLLSSDLLPRTPEAISNLANEWNKCSSSFGVMYGHLAPIDGWLCTTQKPNDVPNPTEYRSGHYQRFGLNVQAMCDPNLRIIYSSVAGPGKMNDARAYR